MKAKNLSYPHPVLGNGDDMAGNFSWVAECDIWADLVTIRPTYLLEHEGLDELIRGGYACFTLEMQCWSTFYRKSFECLRNWTEITLPAQNLRWRVDLGFFVCSKKDLPEYRPVWLHSDYGNCTFSISRGDVLAIGGETSFVADKDFDPMRPPAGALMQICTLPLMSWPAEIDYSDRKIKICLSKDDRKRYSGLPKSCEDMLHGLVVFPVLLDALYEWKKQGESNYANTEWFAKIWSIVSSKKLDDCVPFEMAQRILQDPISRALTGIDQLLVNEDDNG